MQVNEAVLYNLTGENIRQQRLKIDMTQMELANAVGVLRTSISNIEAGRQKPPLHLLYKICMELGVEVVDILPKNVEISLPTVISIDGMPKEELPKTVEELKRLLEE